MPVGYGSGEEPTRSGAQVAEVGRKIQELRRQAGISRQEAARRLSVSYPHYLEIEKGSVAAGSETIRALAGIFGVTATEITGQSDANSAPDADPQANTLRRLVLRQKALLELLIQKGVFDKSEFEEAYRGAGKGS